MGEGDEPADRRGDVEAQLLSTADTTCPYDGMELVNEVRSFRVADLTFTTRRVCPKCGRKFWSSPMTDFLSTFGLSGLAPAWASQVKTLPTRPREEDARALEQRLDEFQAVIEEVQKSLPTRSAELDGLKQSLGELETRVGESANRLAQEQETMLGLVPTAAELAYLKVAKAEAVEIRNLVTQHIEDAHRRDTRSTARAANVRSYIAIGVSVVGLVLAWLRP